MSRRLDERGSTRAERQAAAEVVATLHRKHNKALPDWLAAVTTRNIEQAPPDRLVSNPEADERVKVDTERDDTFKAIQTVVREAFADVLGVSDDTVRSDADFFDDLGGSSLAAARVSNRIESAVGTDVPMRLVCEASTPHELAAAIIARIKSTPMRMSAEPDDGARADEDVRSVATPAKELPSDKNPEAADGDTSGHLTEREVRVLEAWLESDTTREAAAKLFIAESTVRLCLLRVRKRFEAQGRLAGSKAALLARLVEDGYLSKTGDSNSIDSAPSANS